MAVVYGAWYKYPAWRPYVSYSVSSTNTKTTVTWKIGFEVSSNSTYNNHWVSKSTFKINSVTGSKAFNKNVSGFNQISSGSTSYTRTTSAVKKTYSASVNINGAYPGTIDFNFSITIPALTKYTVKYAANGGSSTPSTQYKYYGKSISLAKGISRSGYTFNGWKTTNGATYSGGATYSTNASTTMTAQWVSNSIPKTTVNYYDYTGNLKKTIIYTKDNSAVEKIESREEIVEKDGKWYLQEYTPDGWYTTLTGGTKTTTITVSSTSSKKDLYERYLEPIEQNLKDSVSMDINISEIKVVDDDTIEASISLSVSSYENYIKKIGIELNQGETTYSLDDDSAAQLNSFFDSQDDIATPSLTYSSFSIADNLTVSFIKNDKNSNKYNEYEPLMVKITNGENEEYYTKEIEPKRPIIDISPTGEMYLNNTVYLNKAACGDLIPRDKVQWTQNGEIVNITSPYSYRFYFTYNNHLIRIGNVVQMAYHNARIEPVGTTTTNTTTIGSDVRYFADIPLGFRPIAPHYFVGKASGSGTCSIRAYPTGTLGISHVVDNSGYTNITPKVTNMWFSATWITQDPWPQE